MTTSNKPSKKPSVPVFTETIEIPGYRPSIIRPSVLELWIDASGVQLIELQEIENENSTRIDKNGVFTIKINGADCFSVNSENFPDTDNGQFGETEIVQLKKAVRSFESEICEVLTNALTSGKLTPIQYESFVHMGGALNASFVPDQGLRL